MPVPSQAVKFVPDSPLRRFASRLDLEILEMGDADIRVWRGRDFVADPFFRLYLAERGRTKLMFADSSFQIEEGNLCLLPAHVPFRYVPQDFLHHRWLHFCSRALEGVSCLKRPRSIPLAEFADAPSLIKEIWSLADSAAGLESILRMDFALRKALLPFLARIPEEDAGENLERRNAFSQVLDYIESHLAKSVAMPELAALVRMNRNEFSAAFRDAFGVPPKHYLTRRRVDRSKILLLRTKLSIKEVAAQVGYGNEFFFYRIFKKFAGMTPDEYRRTRNPCR